MKIYLGRIFRQKAHSVKTVGSVPYMLGEYQGVKVAEVARQREVGGEVRRLVGKRILGPGGHYKDLTFTLC